MTVARIVTAPDVRPLMQVAAGDAAVDVGNATYDAAHYGVYPEATYSGTYPSWLDDSCDVVEAVLWYGRQRSSDVFDVGTATLRVANPSGLWDYPPTTDDSSVVAVRPGRQVRVGAAFATPGAAGTPGAAAYLTATVGTVTTPDPATMPAQFVLIAAVAGPLGVAGSANQVIAGQYDADPQRSWLWRRTEAGAAAVWSEAPAGTAAGAGSYTVTGPPISGDVEWLALAYDFNAGTRYLTTWQSLDAGATWQQVNLRADAARPPLIDSTGPVRVGGYGGAGDAWNGRIYSVEARTGLDPAAGAVLWRFDAGDAGDLTVAADTLDTDTDGDGIADNWTAYAGGTPAALTSRTVTGGHQRIVSAPAAVTSEYGVQTTPRYPVSPGRVYTLAARYASTATTSGRPSIFATWYDAAGAPIGTAGGANLADAATPTTYRLTMAAAPANAATLRVILRIVTATTGNGTNPCTLDVYDVTLADAAYTDPRGRTWSLTTANAITPAVAEVPATPAGWSAPSWLWHGWIDATAPAFDPVVGDVITVNAVCAKGEAGRVELARLADAVGASETVPARLHRYCDAARFDPARRLFDGSGTLVAATTLGARAGSLFDKTARSAGGDVFGDQHGYLVYRGKDWQVHDPATPPDAVIGNRGVDGEICPNGWEILFQRSDFASRVNYSGPDGIVHTLDDVADEDAYGVETFNMTGMETVDPVELANLAARMLRVRNFGLAPRVAACTLDAARPGVAAVLAAADPFAPTLYSCGHVTRDGRTVFARTLFLTGVEHTISGGKWTARLALDDAAAWTTNAESRYDAAHYNADRYSRVA